MTKKTSSRAYKSKPYVVVHREKTGRITITRRSDAHPPHGKDRITVSDDAVRFSDVGFGRLKVKPNRKTETAIRKAVRETMKQKPLGKL